MSLVTYGFRPSLRHPYLDGREEYPCKFQVVLPLEPMY